MSFVNLLIKLTTRKRKRTKTTTTTTTMNEPNDLNINLLLMICWNCFSTLLLNLIRLRLQIICITIAKLVLLLSDDDFSSIRESISALDRTDNLHAIAVLRFSNIAKLWLQDQDPTDDHRKSRTLISSSCTSCFACCLTFSSVVVDLKDLISEIDTKVQCLSYCCFAQGRLTTKALRHVNKKN